MFAIGSRHPTYTKFPSTLTMRLLDRSWRDGKLAGCSLCRMAFRSQSWRMEILPMAPGDLCMHSTLGEPQPCLPPSAHLTNGSIRVHLPSQLHIPSVTRAGISWTVPHSPISMFRSRNCSLSQSDIGCSFEPNFSMLSTTRTFITPLLMSSPAVSERLVAPQVSIGSSNLR